MRWRLKILKEPVNAGPSLTLADGTPLGSVRGTGELPVDAQIFLRVMGEDLQGARDLLRDMPPLERAVFLFYTEQCAGLVYEVAAQEGDWS